MKSTLDQHQHLDVITTAVLEVLTKARSEYKPELLFGPDELCISKSIHFPTLLIKSQSTKMKTKVQFHTFITWRIN